MRLQWPLERLSLLETLTEICIIIFIFFTNIFRLNPPPPLCACKAIKRRRRPLSDCALPFSNVLPFRNAFSREETRTNLWEQNQTKRGIGYPCRLVFSCPTDYRWSVTTNPYSGKHKHTENNRYYYSFPNGRVSLILHQLFNKWKNIHPRNQISTKTTLIRR